MTEKIVIKNLFKVFGDHPEKAMRLIDEGIDKDRIFEQTGHVVGVNDASFEIHQGEIFVIMGLSGSGKSTLVRLLNRLIEPTRGQILFDGKDIATMSNKELGELRRNKMSMVFQSFALMPHLNVVENASFGLDLAGVGYQERNERAMTALEQVGLSPYAESYPDELSGGMQQRVGLARGLANDPEVLLMDEAFSALDPLIRSEMQDELLKLQAEQQRTIVFISHDLDEAMRIGDRIAIMEGGRVVQVGTPEDILNNPADDYISSFFRGVDVAKVLSARDIARKTQVTVIQRDGTGLSTALKRLQSDDRDFGYVVCNDLQLQGVVSVDSIARMRGNPEAKLADAFLPDSEKIEADTPLTELMAVVAKAPYAVPVVADNGKYLGVITKASLLETLAPEEEVTPERATNGSGKTAAQPMEAANA